MTGTDAAGWLKVFIAILAVIIAVTLVYYLRKGLSALWDKLKQPGALNPFSTDNIIYQTVSKPFQTEDDKGATFGTWLHKIFNPEYESYNPGGSVTYPDRTPATSDYNPNAITCITSPCPGRSDFFIGAP